MEAESISKASISKASISQASISVSGPQVVSQASISEASLDSAKWYLAENGSITCWLPHNQHVSKCYAALKPCYTGKTHSITRSDGIMIDYEYIIPLTQLRKQGSIKWKWQGMYKDILVKFNFEQHRQEQQSIQESYPEQSLNQLNEIIDKLGKEKHNLHLFRISEGTVLCQHCGELLSDLKKEKKNYLPSCLAQPL